MTTSEQARIAWALMQTWRAAGMSSRSIGEALIRAEWVLEAQASPKDEPFDLHRQRVLRYQIRLAQVKGRD